MNIKAEVLQAELRIRPYIITTPLDYSRALSQQTQAKVFFKLENLQHLNAFKIRGAMNKLLALSAAQLANGVVTASSGNHGGAVALGLNKLNKKGIVFVPEGASSTKVETIRGLGTEVRFHGDNCGVTEIYARRYAEQNNMVYISPYNDLQVIGGQGTIAVELAQQLAKIDAVFVAVGGGGMIAGIAGYLKVFMPDVKIIGCLPENSPVMAMSVQAGKIIEVEEKPTLSDATAGSMEPGAITFELCRQLVDEYILVSEAEIKTAMQSFIEKQHMLLEGAAGVALAAFLKAQENFHGKNIVVVISGANISLQALKSVLS